MNSSNMVKIVITGANSALGRILIPKLCELPNVEQIAALDITPFESISEKVSVKHGDVCDVTNCESMKNLIKGDILIHLAFIVDYPKGMKKRRIYDINVNGSKNVFSAAIQNGVKKIIFLSSQAAYGHLPYSPEYVDEESELLGIKTKKFYYSHTKGLVEKFLNELESDNPNTIITRLRPPVITGPNFNERIPINVDVNRTLTIFRRLNGKNIGQFVNENDLIDVIIKSVENDYHGAYNVAGDDPVDIETYAREYDITLRYIPEFLGSVLIALRWKNLTYSWIVGQKYVSLLKTDKIQKEFGWTPKYSSKECLDDIILPQLSTADHKQ